MTINQYSRYVDNTVLNLQDPEGVSRATIIINPPGEQRIRFSTYTWQIGDQIEYLAFSAYADEESWWIIANANPEILYWDSIKPGTTIRVPNGQ
jgi:hypothetical protein